MIIILITILDSIVISVKSRVKRFEARRTSQFLYVCQGTYRDSRNLFLDLNSPRIDSTWRFGRL